MKIKKSSFWSVLCSVDAIITAVTLSLCTIIVNLNVFMRYFLNRPLFWAEEVSTGLFVWTVFIGSAYAFRKHAHLGVDILINLIPESIQKYVKVAMDFVGLLILIMLTFISIQYVVNTWDKLTNTLRVPNWYIAIAVPIGFGLSLIYSVYFIVLDVIKAAKKKGVTKTCR
ncbi:MAG: TRAP transporter small permease [Lawsonibacter sp.]|nr:TRAP transporter small permease [Lawsonibacter sp.]